VVSGSEAIQTAGEMRPDLVLMDIQLKGKIDGISAAEQIHHHLKIPIIYLTAHTDQRTLKRAIATEAFGYLVKPFNQTELHTTIEIALLRNQFEKRLEAIEQQLSPVAPTTWQPPGALPAIQIKEHTSQPAEPCVLNKNGSERAVGELELQLEQQVQERTLQLQQALDFEALLKRITDKVRDSLDESQIMQTAIRELAEELDTSSCDTGLYDLERRISTITYEYIRAGIPTAQGKVIDFADHQDIYNQLFDGQPFQFCKITTADLARQLAPPFTVLACPLITDQGVMGDLWLYRIGEEGFTAPEIRLVQQVANQCAIAIRQARLYTASQAQVTELERLNHLKDDFLNTISHELRTPISSIKMASQLLEIRLKGLGLLESDAEQTGRYLQILQSECDREITLINNMLDLSRLDAQMEPISQTSIRLQDWIPHLLEPFTVKMQQQQQHLIMDIPIDLSPVVSDLASLGRVLTELFNNAFKYTPAMETIKVSARVEAREVARVSERVGRGLQGSLPPAPTFLAISVSNSGVEILPHEQARIFDKFYRVPNTDPWKHGGTGLGLALVKRLVSHVSGDIQVVSEQNWTTFTIYLPR
jgi:signal transduction histidine kinase